MNKVILLQELYLNSFKGNIDRVSLITDRLLKKGVSYRIINKVFILANASIIVDNVYLTIVGMLQETGEYTFSLN